MGRIVRTPAVLFDLGGTLVDLRGVVKAMASHLDTLRIPDPVGTALTWANRTAERLPRAQGSHFRSELDLASGVLSEILAPQGLLRAESEAAHLVAKAWSEFVAHSQLQPDASASWLRRLRGRARLGLVTDSDSEGVAGLIAHLGLEGVFECITISQEVRAYKPAARMYRTALKTLGTPPETCVFVSDSPLDLQGAAKVGIAGAWIRRGLLPDLADTPRGTFLLRSLKDVDSLVTAFRKTGRFRLS